MHIWKPFAREQKMPAAKIGRLWSFKISKVDAWSKSGVVAEK